MPQKPQSSIPSDRAEAREALPRAALLGRAMGVLQSALWEARASNLELVSLEFGEGAAPFLPLDVARPDRPLRWSEHVYPLDRPQIEAYFSGADGSSQKPIEYRLILSSGELLWVRHWVLERVRTLGGDVRLRGVIAAIPEQKLLEWECLRVSERERNRIGQELHDDMCQVLAGVSYLLRVLGRRVTAAAPDLKGEFDDLDQQVVAAMMRARAMAHGLFPAQLKETPLRQALADLAQQIKTRFDVPVSVHAPPRLPVHTTDQIVHVYRIVQEAVRNAIAHGGAKAIEVRVDTKADGLALCVEDDGAGFPSDTAWPEGIGLHVMQYRARVLGGTIEFGNRPNGGACVRLEYPLDGDAGGAAGGDGESED